MTGRTLAEPPLCVAQSTSLASGATHRIWSICAPQWLARTSIVSICFISVAIQDLVILLRKLKDGSALYSDSSPGRPRSAAARHGYEHSCSLGAAAAPNIWLRR